MPRRRAAAANLPTKLRAAAAAFGAGRGPRVFEEHMARLAGLPAHGNRRLTYDLLVRALLLAFFDPAVRSLRGIADQGDFGGRLALPPDLSRLAKSTTSDALAVFDPKLLRPLVADLLDRCPGLGHDDPSLHALGQRIVAADGTYFTVFSDVAWALRHTKQDGRTQAQVRANVQLDVSTWCPQVVTVSGDDGESEPAAFARDLLPGVLYVVDRNFVEFGLLSAVRGKNSHFVVRVRANAPACRALSARKLTAADVEAGVASDEDVLLTGKGAPEGVMRLVTVATTGRDGKATELRLLTSLTEADVPAATVAAAYRARWQVELFFKWLKTWARMDALMSASRNGITIQLYAMVIGVLAMHAATGTRVGVYALNVFSSISRGTMTLGHGLGVIAERERERAMDRARQARRRARKKLA